MMDSDDTDSVMEMFKSLTMLLGLVYFISLMIFDAHAAIAGKPARIWVPGKYLVISALMIQIISYLKIKQIQFSEDGVSEKNFQDFLQNVFVGESGRVVTCVLIGYLLPGMARAGSATDWTTLAALALSLFTSEFYYSTLFYNWQDFYLMRKKTKERRVSVINTFYFRFAINVVLMVSIILVVLFQVSAIIAGRTIRDMLADRISVIQWDKSEKNEEILWEKFEGEIAESWLLARVCHPQYVIARSVLSSAVGMVVTTCILFLVILQFDLFVDYLGQFSKYNLLFIAWTLEWVFILIAGAVIYCRWFTAVVYFPRFFVNKTKPGRCTRPFVEDYWTRSILELVQMYNLQKWRLQEQSKDGESGGLALRMATTMKIHYLLYLLWPLQISLVCFSKCCFFLSELLFSFKFVWNCLLGSGTLSSQSDREFKKHKELLEKVCMPGENPESLWVANKKSMEQAKNRFSENKTKGLNCDDLVALISPHFHLESDDDERFVYQLERLPFVAEHFPALNENCMSMTALSLLNVIIRLLPLQEDVNRPPKAVAVYRQALDLMSFVDNSNPQHPTTIDVRKVIDIEADRVGMAVCSEFQRLLKPHKEKHNSLKKSPRLADPEAAPDRAFEAINELLQKAEEQLNAQKLAIINKEEQSGGACNSTQLFCDSRDWRAIVPSYSNYRVCKLILSRDFNNENELMEYLYESLADVIVFSLSKLPGVLVKRCREWAVKFEEEKIWAAMSIAGKVVGVMQKCNVEVEGNFLEPLSPTTSILKSKRG